jgi:MerR family redox-sensitive transcriptional activator SoxR
MTALAIGEVARRAGLNSSALRYYERIGLLPEPERVGGQRRYDASVLTRLAVIELAKRAGFSLQETRTLLDGFSPTTSPSERWQALARRKLPEIENQLARIDAMRQLLTVGLECDCLSLEECGMLIEPARLSAES